MSNKVSLPMYKAENKVTSSSRKWSDLSESPETRDYVFNSHSKQDGEHVSPFDNGATQIGLDGIEVKLVKGINEEQFANVVSYGLRATTGVDLNKPYDDSSEDLTEMMQGGLQQALEADTLVFAVSGVSRACTHQLVRTRKAAFNQQSQRATFYGNQPDIRMPESIWRDKVAREAYLEAIKATRRAYKVATERDISYQDARLVLPEGTVNFIICTYTVREFMNTFSYRGCYLFQWEISHVFRKMREQVLENHPILRDVLAQNIKISCEKTGKCHFQGWEDVEAQCPKPMAREDNRVFKSDRYAIETKAKTPLQILREGIADRSLIQNDDTLEMGILMARLINEGYPSTSLKTLIKEAIAKAEHAGDLPLVK